MYDMLRHFEKMSNKIRANLVQLTSNRGSELLKKKNHAKLNKV